MTRTALGTVLVLVGVTFFMSGITFWFTIGWWAALPQFFLSVCQIVVAASTLRRDDGDSPRYQPRMNTHAPYTGHRHDYWAGSGAPRW